MTAPVILAFGDSNTHGTAPIRDWSVRERYALEERWTTRLRDLTGANVVAEGHPGRTTVHDDPVEGEHKNGLTALPVILESHAPVDLVITMLGTNDCKARFSVGPDDIARSIDRLLGAIAAGGYGPEGRPPVSLLVSPPPLSETGLIAGVYAGGAAKSQRLAKALAEVAAARGAWFLDAGLHVDVSTVDGVHLTPDGHAGLAAAIAPLVARCLGLPGAGPGG